MNKKQLVMLAKKHHLMPALYNLEHLVWRLRKRGIVIDNSPMEAEEINETEDEIVSFYKDFLSRKETIKKYGQ